MKDFIEHLKETQVSLKQTESILKELVNNTSKANDKALEVAKSFEKVANVCRNVIKK